MKARLFLDGSEDIDILALHGFGGDGQDFSLIRSASSLRWGTLDLLGHGRSEKSLNPIDYNVESQLVALREHNVGRVLLGYSMGARLALQAILNGIGAWQGLILISGTAGLREGRKKRVDWDTSVAERLQNTSHEEFWSYWSSLPILSSQKDIETDFLQKRAERRKAACLDSLAASMQGFGAGAMPSVWEYLESIDIPILLIVGEKDSKYVALGKDLLKELPHAELIQIRDSGHAPHLEKPRQTAAVIGEWYQYFGGEILV